MKVGLGMPIWKAESGFGKAESGSSGLPVGSEKFRARQNKNARAIL